MKILFCNIAYMKNYDGNTIGDIPTHGGSYVTENQDCDEKYNFLNVNGKCYGSVEHRGNKIGINRLYNVSKCEEWVEGIDIIWCARNNNGKTVIVGWYRNAKVYRECRFIQSSINHGYYFEADAKNCYLLPESERKYVIGRAAEDGTGKGFGRENYWYADSEYGKEIIVPAVLEYINNYSGERINIQNEAFDYPDNLNVIQTDEEFEKANEYYKAGEWMKFLPYAYRSFAEMPSADNAYFIAETMKELLQYDRAIDWYNKVIELEGEIWATLAEMLYVYSHCNKFEETINIANKLLNYDEASDKKTRCIIYGTMATANSANNQKEEAINWLNKIIEISEDADEIAFVKEYKEELYADIITK